MSESPQTLIERRKSWAADKIRTAVVTPPRYGSESWLALDLDNPAKLAAVVVAAEAWATDGDNIEERLRAEVEAERRAFKDTEDAEYLGRIAAHRAEWSGMANRRPIPGRANQEMPPRDLYDIGRAAVGGDAA